MFHEHGTVIQRAVIQKTAYGSGGFSLLELIAVMVIVAVVAATATVRLMPTSFLELQSARDQVISALSYAQQKALYSPHAIRVLTLAGTIDIRQDINDDGLFPSSESIRFGSVQYPLTLTGGVQLSTHTLNYTTLGETSATDIIASKSGKSLTVAISASGFAQ